MRFAILIPALLLAACDSGPEWENEQATLANELNATAPAADQNASETDYINTASPAANDVNAAAPAANEAEPPPAG
jgi:hypothetical protein